MSQNNTPQVGKLITTDDCFRDAIHVAVAPVVAGTVIGPGDHVGLNRYGYAVPEGTPIGVVDPFLRENVHRGETFWLFVYPNTVTNLRHAWQHEAFRAKPPEKHDAP